jgi:mannobiose 2-epimerase
MTITNPLAALGPAAETELRERILPFWATRAVDAAQGGFFGQIEADGRPDPNAGKGGVLNARILWTFSAALRHHPDALYRTMADRAFAFVTGPLWDPEHSGLFWEVDRKGAMLNGRKQTYGQAFGIYGLAEYFRATGVREALDRAMRLFELIEARAFDPERGGYWEARGRDWAPIDDIRLSDRDMNAPFSMNTHLHLLEAYTCLALASGEPRVRERLRALIEIVLDRIIDPRTGRQILFQDLDWWPMSAVISPGHDIETSWLICEAAQALGDEALNARAERAAVRLADAVIEWGLDAVNGGIYYEAVDGHEDTDKHWWVQAEGVVGFLNAYALSGDGRYLDAALRTGQFIDDHQIDRGVGEWHNRVTVAGATIPDLPIAGFWKCPYHNARAMIEIAERVAKLEGAGRP